MSGSALKRAIARPTASYSESAETSTKWPIPSICAYETRQIFTSGSLANLWLEADAV